MKILSIAAGIALALSANIAIAQDNVGGSDAVDSTVGGVKKSTIAAGAVGLAVVGGILGNNRGSIAKAPVVNPPDEPMCEGDDPLVDGVCTGTTSTVTVTASGTGTTTISVPVTFTYLPSV